MNYELINYCEFDNYASKAYSLIHNEPESKNLGDITKVNEKEIADFNMMVGGSPCQDFSVAGKQKGAEWNCQDCKHKYNPLEVHHSKRNKCPKCESTNIEKTRSSLVVEWLRILKEKKPNLAIYENVKNLVGKKHKHFFDLFIAELHEYGYSTHWKVLNAKNYGIPQNRERVYLIIIKKELDNGKFKFPEGFDNGIRLKDVLEKEVDEKYYISQEKTEKLISQLKDKNSLVLDMCQAKREGKPREYSDFSPTLSARDYKEPRLVNSGVIQVGNIVDTGNWDNPQRGRIYSTDGCSPALNTCGGGGLEPKILEDNKIIQVGCIEGTNFNQNKVVYDVNGISPTIQGQGHCGNEPKILEDFYANRDIREYEEYSPTLRADRQGLKVLENTESPNPELVGGVGEINFGKQYRQGNRVYSSDKTAMCLLSQPVGNAGGNSYLYLVQDDKDAIENISSEYQFAKDKCMDFYNKNGYLPKMFNPYNQAEITDIAPTQTTSCNRSCSSATVLIKDTYYRIRKLIPLECFRLMAFEDKDFYILKDNKISDSQCYKMAGNSIVVDVLYYIYKELYSAMPYLFEDIKLSSFFSGIGAFEKALTKL